MESITRRNTELESTLKKERVNIVYVGVQEPKQKKLGTGMKCRVQEKRLEEMESR